MKSPFYFLIEPFNKEEYVNTNENGIIINTSIEDHVYTQRLAKVLSTPIGYNGEVEEGDIVVVHHNTFRTQYDNQGFPRPSMYHIKDSLYYIDVELVYAIVIDNKLKAVEPFCFVEPIEEDTEFEGTIESEKIGKLFCIPDSLKKQGFKEGDSSYFKTDSEYEFNILGRKLYMMEVNRLLAVV